MEPTRVYRLTSLSVDAEGCLAPIEAKTFLSARVRHESDRIYTIEHRGPASSGEPRARLGRYYLYEEEEHGEDGLVRRWSLVGVVCATRGNRLGGAFRLQAAALLHPSARHPVSNPSDETSAETLRRPHPHTAFLLADPTPKRARGG